MDIEIAKEILKRIDIKFFLNGMTEQNNYIIDKADEINIAIGTVLSELEKKEAIINEMAKDIKSADEFLDSMGYMGEYAKFTIEEIIEEYERIEKF